MRILLDTNVWRYIVDADASAKLKKVAANSKSVIQIAPAVVYETLGMSDKRTRDKIIHLVTDPNWQRLMPEAFSEAEELKREIRRLRTEWLREKSDLNTFNRFRYDWKRDRGGFWTRVRMNTDGEAERISYLDAGLREKARAAAYESRQSMMKVSPKNAQTPLDKLHCAPAGPLLAWDGMPTELWRLSGLWHLQSLLYGFIQGSENHPYAQWLGAELDWAAIFHNSHSFNRFWLYEVRPEALPRFWLRGAFEFLQQWYKVTDGTPGDSQLSTYLVESDVIVSADNNLIRFVERCRKFSPVPIAKGYHIQGGVAGLDRFLADVEMDGLRSYEYGVT